MKKRKLLQKVVKPKDAETKDVHLDILKYADMDNNADIKADVCTNI